MAHGVTVINIGGQERTVCFNNHSLMFIGKACNCDPALIDKEIMNVAAINELRALTFIIYGGLMGCLESEAIYIHDVTLQSVSKWVGDANVDEFTSVWAVFTDTLKLPKATAKQIKEYEKKLAAGTEKKN
jgi:hypothetical protein